MDSATGRRCKRPEFLRVYSTCTVLPKCYRRKGLQASRQFLRVYSTKTVLPVVALSMSNRPGGSLGTLATPSASSTAQCYRSGTGRGAESIQRLLPGLFDMDIATRGCKRPDTSSGPIRHGHCYRRVCSTWTLLQGVASVQILPPGLFDIDIATVGSNVHVE